MQGVQQKKLSNSSNYMVSNDGVQIMDLPRTMNAPRKAVPSGRTTPILIPPLKYIVYNNPQVAYDFLISKGYNVEPNIPSTYQFARIFVKERGDEGVLEFVGAAHPDKDLILKATGHNENSSFCCGFDGNNQTPPPASGAKTPEQTQTTTQEVKQEAGAKTTSESKTEGKEGILKINTQTIIIILVIIVFFLLINRATK